MGPICPPPTAGVSMSRVSVSRRALLRVGRHIEGPSGNTGWGAQRARLPRQLRRPGLACSPQPASEARSLGTARPGHSEESQHLVSHRPARSPRHLVLGCAPCSPACRPGRGGGHWGSPAPQSCRCGCGQPLAMAVWSWTPDSPTVGAPAGPGDARGPGQAHWPRPPCHGGSGWALALTPSSHVSWEPSGDCGAGIILERAEKPDPP